MRTKFKFGDQVKISEGFYEGVKGNVISCKKQELFVEDDETFYDESCLIRIAWHDLYGEKFIVERWFDVNVLSPYGKGEK